MSKQELKKRLYYFWRAWEVGCMEGDKNEGKKAYKQIKELINDSDTAAWMDKCHELGLEVAELKKKAVTGEWVDRLALGMPSLHYNKVDYIKHELKEIGVEVK